MGNKTFYRNEPVLYFDTLKTSSLEGAANTVYAMGGRGNPRLIGWDGERTLTFNMEDALISPESFSILSGAGLTDASEEAPMYVHTTSQLVVKEDNKIVLPQEACWSRYPMGDEYRMSGADIFVMTMTDGQIDSEPCVPYAVDEDHKTITCYGHKESGIPVDSVVLVDYYVKRTTHAQKIEITADKFGGSYYVEASCLFRDEKTQTDMPAEFVIPSAKVQSNFTFTMANSGDPSTFSFVLDAMPDYTKFDLTHKVLAEVQVITDAADSIDEYREPCKPTLTVTTVDDKLVVEYDKDAEKMTVTGEDVNGENNYSNTLFGTINGSATELDLKFATIDSTKRYRITQQNPGLGVYFASDANVTGNVKDKTYGPGDLDEGYALLLTDQEGAIFVDVYELADESDTTGTRVQGITITNNVTFAPKNSRISTKASKSIYSSTDD